MAEPRSRTRRADEKTERATPERRRAEAEADLRSEDETEPAPRRKKAGTPERRRRADQPSGTSRSTSDDRSAKSRPSSRASASGVDARRAAGSAAKYVIEMTGNQPEGLTSLEHTDDGWRVGVEVLESRRIPDSTDILAEYQVDLDGDGGLVSYRRTRRYYRGRVEGGEQL